MTDEKRMMYEAKKAFVHDYIEPMCKQLRLGVHHVEYEYVPHPEHEEWVREIVTVYYGEGNSSKQARVDGDGNFGILKDIIGQGALG